MIIYLVFKYIYVVIYKFKIYLYLKWDDDLKYI